MTAQGSRRTALVLAIALLALFAWRSWPAPGPLASASPKDEAPTDTRKNPALQVEREAGFHSSDAPSPSTVASHPEPEASDGNDACSSNRRFYRIRDALDPERSPEDAFAHAVLAAMLSEDGFGDEAAQRREAVRSQSEWGDARRRWPGDLDIAWQAARNCQSRFGCDEDDALRHLQGLDPGNAAVWMLSMHDAWDRRDFAQYDAYLDRAAAADYYAPRYGSLFRALQPTLAAEPVPERCLHNPHLASSLAKSLGRAPGAGDWAAAEALSLEFALNAPMDYGSFAGCRSSSGLPVPETRRGSCVVALSMLAEGNSFIERDVALPLLIQLLGNSAEGMAYRERYRRTLYLSLAIPKPGIFEGDPMRIMEAGEFETRRQLAIAQHRWPPPTDWMPRSAYQQALITRGNAPPPGIND